LSRLLDSTPSWTTLPPITVEGTYYYNGEAPLQSQTGILHTHVYIYIYPITNNHHLYQASITVPRQVACSLGKAKAWSSMQAESWISTTSM
jgi:hypothetical protein